MGSTDIEQRNGRIIRQGNEFGKIVEGNYIDNLIRAQREQELTKTGEKRT